MEREAPELAGRKARRILVGFDGSDQAVRALEFVLDAFGEGNEIHLVYVVQEPKGIPDPVPDEVMDTHRAVGQERLSEAERIVRSGLSNAVLHLESGNPGEKLLELADVVRPDLVVLGTLRHSTAERLLGTTSTHFLRARRYPLLIVP
jgi:nucleotide-binding universal stress UspA family protein